MQSNANMDGLTQNANHRLDLAQCGNATQTEQKGRLEMTIKVTSSQFD